jgi:hypothetical protein
MWAYQTTNRGSLVVTLQAGLANGVTLPARSYPLSPLPPNQRNAEVRFNVRTVWTERAAGSNRVHYPRAIIPELATGPVAGIPVTIPYTADTEQWRLYRQLDDGPLTLLAEGTITNAARIRPAAATKALSAGEVRFEDQSMPANVAQARYHTQCLDVDGNAGQLVSVEAVLISSPPPSPTLLSIEPGGGTNDPASTMTINWSAAPYGIARYRIWIGNPELNFRNVLQPIAIEATRSSSSAKALAPPTDLRSLGLLRVPVYRDFTFDGGTTNLACTVIDTTIIGGRVGSGPLFSNLVSRATISADLYVLVEPVAVDGSVGEASRTVILRAGAGIPSSPIAPWPKRPLPPIETDFTGDSFFPIAATRIKRGNADGAGNGDFDGVGIRIGIASIAGSNPAQGRNAYLNGLIDPDSVLFHDPETELPLFGRYSTTVGTGSPFIEVSLPLFTKPQISAVLYRQQVPSAAFPQPPGELLQVSPMMPGITHQRHENILPFSAGVVPPATQIIDPFIAVFRGSPSMPYDLYLLDTQPVVADAAYRYFLVRFDQAGEMINVLPTGPVTITP